MPCSVSPSRVSQTRPAARPLRAGPAAAAAGHTRSDLQQSRSPAEARRSARLAHCLACKLCQSTFYSRHLSSISWSAWQSGAQPGRGHAPPTVPANRPCQPRRRRRQSAGALLRPHAVSARCLGHVCKVGRLTGADPHLGMGAVPLPSRPRQRGQKLDLWNHLSLLQPRLSRFHQRWVKFS